MNGFSSQVNVQVTGLPASVSVTPASITLTPGTPLQVSLSVANPTTSVEQAVTFTGTSGSLTHTAQLNLTVVGSLNPAPVRTRYVRTDATTEYYTWPNQNWIVYDSNTARYFVTDPSQNQVFVVDGVSKEKIGVIGVPGAFGISETPDLSTIYVGTLFGNVYAIDPVGMSVTKEYLASKIGPSGFPALSALVLADGRLALLGTTQEEYGDTTVAVWNPTDNSITTYGELGGLPLPCSNASSLGTQDIQGQGTIEAFTLSADRTQIILSLGGICEINASTGTGIVATGPDLNEASTEHIVVSPDGKYVILAGDVRLSVPVAVMLDAETLVEVSEFNVLGDTSSAAGFFVSADSKTLFTPSFDGSLIYAYSLATQQLVGWVPNIYVLPTAGGGASGPIDNPYFLTNDGTGLYAGPLEQGIGFVDLSALQTGPVGTGFTTGSLTPATGPTTGGTTIQLFEAVPMAPLLTVDFDSLPAGSISTSMTNAGGIAVTATSPAGLAGPADVYLFTNDGGMQLLPEGFSYGPTILEVTPNMATAEGGGTGCIYGYGFGPVASKTAPTDLQVAVGGITATVTGFTPQALELAPPLQSLSYAIPPGAAGSAANVSVSTNSGSAKASGALSYLPAIQQFPLPGSALAQGVYDANNGLYYFTDTNLIRVFSRAEGEWLSPITIPAPAGATQRLWGIALSPDGSIMAVSDAKAGAIYVLHPATPTSVKTFIVGTSQGASIINPCAVAVSDSGNVYYAVFMAGSFGGDQFFKLNTNTSAITNYGIAVPGSQYDIYLRNLISSDNSKVFLNEEGQVQSIDTATDKVSNANTDFGCCYGDYELALSSNQAQLTATSYIYDFDLDAESYYAQNDREILNIAYVYGAKFSEDGRLLFQPSTNGIDVLDGELGNLLNRISLPVALSANYDALVEDGTDNILIAITGTGDGIAIVDLSSISEPPPLPNKRGMNWLAHRTPRQSDRRVRSRPDARQTRLLRPEVVPHVTTTLHRH